MCSVEINDDSLLCASCTRQFSDHLDVCPVHGDVCVPVWSVLLVLEAEGVEQLVHHHLEVDTPVLLQPDLHPPVPEPGTTCYLHLHLRGVVAHL